MKFNHASWHYEGGFLSDVPEEAGAIHLGRFYSWALVCGLGGELHALDRPEQLEEPQSPSITPVALFTSVCDSKLTDEDLSQEGNTFASECYTLQNGNSLAYSETTSDGKPPSIYPIADSCENFDRIKPAFDWRFAEGNLALDVIAGVACGFGLWVHYWPAIGGGALLALLGRASRWAWSTGSARVDTQALEEDDDGRTGRRRYAPGSPERRRAGTLVRALSGYGSPERARSAWRADRRSLRKSAPTSAQETATDCGTNCEPAPART
jgi:hypothetical protein